MFKIVNLFLSLSALKLGTHSKSFQLPEFIDGLIFIVRLKLTLKFIEMDFRNKECRQHLAY